MSITKISGAELHRKSRDLTIDESAYLDGFTDEQIEHAALADPDANPTKLDLLRRGQVDRTSRIVRDQLERLGCQAVEAEPELDLPIWEITDEKRGKVFIKAVAVLEAFPTTGDAIKVLKLEAVQKSGKSGEDLIPH